MTDGRTGRLSRYLVLCTEQEEISAIANKPRDAVRHVHVRHVHSVVNKGGRSVLTTLSTIDVPWRKGLKNRLNSVWEIAEIM